MAKKAAVATTATKPEPKGPDAKGRKMYAFRFYKDEMDRLEAIAEAERTTVTAVMSALIRRKIEESKEHEQH